MDYLYDNLEKLDYTAIDSLVNYLQDKSEIYSKFLDKILSISNQKVRDSFIESSIAKRVSFDMKNIVRSFYRNTTDFDSLSGYSEKSLLNSSTLPKFLLFYARKHDPDTEKNLFLIAPTDLQIIYDVAVNPILYVEKQSYLSKSHNGKPMTQKDIAWFLEELDRQGFEVTDPHCITGKFDNFGFLNDYHDANITVFLVMKIYQTGLKKDLL